VKKLPIKLGKEPLIDAVCAVNFISTGPAESLLPGLLLSKFVGKSIKFEQLPAAQLPQQIRSQDPALKNAPLIRLVVDEKFAILIGSQILAVGCLMPYPGWQELKCFAVDVFSVLQGADFVTTIERHSMKYVDFIPSTCGGGELSCFNAAVELGGVKVVGQNLHLRAELPEAPFLHVVSIISKATISSNEQVEGSVVDVDTLRIEGFSVASFVERLPDLLEDIHSANKVFFFSLLHESCVERLEPEYA
jgi:uncharacterized protein (TIGR04255 family)